MKTTFISLMALGVAAAMAGPADRALAGEPMVLTDAQLDRVTAGAVIINLVGFPFGDKTMEGQSQGVQQVSNMIWDPDEAGIVIINREGERTVFELPMGAPPAAWNE